MEKNNQPYSQPSNLRLAFSTDFASFVVVQNKFYGNFKMNKDWRSVDIVPGTLKASCLGRAESSELFDINVSFRVSYASANNQLEMENWAKYKVIVLYTSASGLEKIAGTKEYPLKMVISNPDGFDGFECSLTGIQTTAECFK